MIGLKLAAVAVATAAAAEVLSACVPAPAFYKVSHGALERRTGTLERGVLTTEWLEGSATITAAEGQGQCGTAVVTRRFGERPTPDSPQPESALAVAKLSLCAAGSDGDGVRYRLEGEQTSSRNGFVHNTRPFPLREFSVALDGESLLLKGVPGAGRIPLPAGAGGESVRAHPEVIGAALILDVLTRTSDGRLALR